jgi:predicted nucleic acid-binding Zn ribbon protein
MERIGDLLPEAARRLGLEEELRLARATAAWEAILAERVPAAAGLARLVALTGPEATIATSHPIVAQELRLRERELAEALAAALGGSPAIRFRMTVGGG